MSGCKDIPYLLADTPAYGVVYKPPRMHSVPLKGDAEGETLLDWCAGLFPELRTLRGKQPWEGGILHRLDYETQGLVLFAKTQTALEALNIQQETGYFIKTYRALSVSCANVLPGFPPAPQLRTVPGIIESGFRPFGPGQQAVRPVAGSVAKKGKLVLDRGKPYCTELTARYELEGYTCFHLRISRGFRHQIRCHLAWLGFPLLNDMLYGGISVPREADFAPLALIAWALSFYDPVSAEPRCYTIPDFPESSFFPY